MWLAVLRVASANARIVRRMDETILIVDDHPGFRACAREFLEAEGFEVVGEAGDATSAIRPRASSPRTSSSSTSSSLTPTASRRPSKSIAGTKPAIILTSSRDVSYLAGVLSDSPACGFIPKSELSGAAVRALVS